MSTVSGGRQGGSAERDDELDRPRDAPWRLAIIVRSAIYRVYFISATLLSF